MNIRLKNLEKKFYKKPVLNIENLEFTKGLTCIMGSNGSGKSTLLNIISGNLNYENGQVLYNDKPFTKDIYSSMTLVEQKPYMLSRSVYDNVAYPLRIRRYTNREVHTKVEEILQNLQITELKKNRGDELSGGEIQKVALARALVFSPKLLMLDESTSNMDKKSLENVERIIRNYAQMGNTVLFVTHDLNQAKSLTENIVNLQEV